MVVRMTQGMKREAPKVSRKDFLKALGVAFGAGAIACGGGGTESSSEGGIVYGASTTVYRLSNHNRKCCKACKGHATYKLFKTAIAAESNRPHDGCNCKVKTFVVLESEAALMFSGGDIYDSRSGA